MDLADYHAIGRGSKKKPSSLGASTTARNFSTCNTVGGHRPPLQHSLFLFACRNIKRLFKTWTGWRRSEMPIYEYECLKCGHQFEYLVLPASPEPTCPECRRQDLKRLVSLCAVSSEATRQAHLDRARKQYGKVNREKQYEEHKQAHHHDD